MGFQIPQPQSSTMLEYRLKEHMRLFNDLTAYELLETAKIYDGLSSKYDRLVRKHRQQVFDDRSGDAHHRALVRLQKTTTSKAMAYARYCNRQERIGKQLTGMGY